MANLQAPINTRRDPPWQTIHRCPKPQLLTGLRITRVNPQQPQMSSSPRSDPPRRTATPRPVSSVYSEYVPPSLDPLRPSRAPQTPGPSASWAPPRVRGRDAPFPAHQRPGQSRTPGPLQPVTRMERGRGIAIAASPTAAAAAAAVDRRRMYFDLQLGEWRTIPGKTQLADASPAPLKRAKRSRLKRLVQGLVRIVRDLANPTDRRERENEQRRAKLRASISPPLGNHALRR